MYLEDSISPAKNNSL